MAKTDRTERLVGAIEKRDMDDILLATKNQKTVPVAAMEAAVQHNFLEAIKYFYVHKGRAINTRLFVMAVHLDHSETMMYMWSVAPKLFGDGIVRSITHHNAQRCAQAVFDKTLADKADGINYEYLDNLSFVFTTKEAIEKNLQGIMTAGCMPSVCQHAVSRNDFPMVKYLHEDLGWSLRKCDLRDLVHKADMTVIPFLTYLIANGVCWNPSYNYHPMQACVKNLEFLKCVEKIFGPPTAQQQSKIIKAIVALDNDATFASLVHVWKDTPLTEIRFEDVTSERVMLFLLHKHCRLYYIYSRYMNERLIIRVVKWRNKRILRLLCVRFEAFFLHAAGQNHRWIVSTLVQCGLLPDKTQRKRNRLISQCVVFERIKSRIAKRQVVKFNPRKSV